MKKLIFIHLFLILSSTCVYAQRTTEKGGYIKDSNLEKFVGTWQGTSGNDTLTIVFTKRKVHFEEPADVYMDLILGWYKYVENGHVIDNFLDEVGSGYKKSILNGATDEDNPLKLDLNFADYKRDKTLYAPFEIKQQNKNEATLNVSVSEGIYLENKAHNKKKPNVPVPSTWKMKKIK